MRINAACGTAAFFLRGMPSRVILRPMIKTQNKTKPPVRCPWATTDSMIVYHDQEWGVPLHDDRLLFEFLILEGAQAGLSWSTVLRKRDAYRHAFDRFDPRKVAHYDKRKI